MPKIKILNLKKEIELEIGEKFLTAADTGVLPIRLKCRAGACGSCRFEVVSFMENLSPKSKAEERFFKTFPSSEFSRLACQCRAMGDIEIKVPTDTHG